MLGNFAERLRKSHSFSYKSLAMEDAPTKPKITWLKFSVIRASTYFLTF